MRRIYVDYENVQGRGLAGISRLDADDVVCVVYTDKAVSLPIPIHKEILEARADVVFEHVACGTANALDFQLVSLMACDIARLGDEAAYIIVSRDGGYRCLVEFWRARAGADVRVAPSVAEVAASGLEQAVEKAAAGVLGAKGDVRQVAAIISSCETKAGINHALQKRFGNNRCGKVYSAIKPLLRDKR